METETQQPPKDGQPNPDKGPTGKKIFFTLLITIIIVLSIVLFVQCVNASANDPNHDGSIGNNNTPTLLHRNARESDISIQTSDELSLRINFTLVPKVDIEGLELTFSFKNKNGEIIANIVKYIGNVSEDQQYNVSISLTEFSLTQIFTIREYRYSVSGGSVSYFA